MSRIAYFLLERYEVGIPLAGVTSTRTTLAATVEVTPAKGMPSSYRSCTLLSCCLLCQLQSLPSQL